MARWVEWVDPYDKSFVAVLCYMRAEEAIKAQRKLHNYESDEEALADFVTVNWGRVVNIDPREAIELVVQQANSTEQVW